MLRVLCFKSHQIATNSEYNIISIFPIVIKKEFIVYFSSPATNIISPYSQGIHASNNTKAYYKTDPCPFTVLG